MIGLHNEVRGAVVIAIIEVEEIDVEVESMAVEAAVDASEKSLFVALGVVQKGFSFYCLVIVL